MGFAAKNNIEVKKAVTALNSAKINAVGGYEKNVQKYHPITDFSPIRKSKFFHLFALFLKNILPLFFNLFAIQLNYTLKYEATK